MASQIHHIPTVWNPSYAVDAMEKELGVPLERTHDRMEIRRADADGRGWTPRASRNRAERWW